MFAVFRVAFALKNPIAVAAAALIVGLFWLCVVLPVMAVYYGGRYGMRRWAARTGPYESRRPF